MSYERQMKFKMVAAAILNLKTNYQILIIFVFSPGSAETNAGWGGKMNGPLMASCVRQQADRQIDTRKSHPMTWELQEKYTSL